MLVHLSVYPLCGAACAHPVNSSQLTSSGGVLGHHHISSISQDGGLLVLADRQGASVHLKWQVFSILLWLQLAVVLEKLVVVMACALPWWEVLVE